MSNLLLLTFLPIAGTMVTPSTAKNGCTHTPPVVSFLPLMFPSKTKLLQQDFSQWQQELELLFEDIVHSPQCNEVVAEVQQPCCIVGERTICVRSESYSCCHCEKSCCSISNFSSKSNFNCCQNCKKSHHIVFISSLNSNFSWSSHCHHEKSIHNKCNPSSSCSSRVALVGLVA